MIAARWTMLLAATLLVVAALGAFASDTSPSALRVVVAAVVALFAPLFWPGMAATPARTALRVAGWSAAAACLAAVVLVLLGSAAQTLTRIFGSCAMLMLILLVTHAVAAGLEWQWHKPTLAAGSAREMAGRAAAIALALLGALPLWLGPMGELLAGRQAWIIDAVVGLSPLTHLAVASDNDLLRNQWLYQNANLASLRFGYPSLADVTWSYALLTFVLALVALAFRRSRRLLADAPRTRSTMEKPQS